MRTPVIPKPARPYWQHVRPKPAPVEPCRHHLAVCRERGLYHLLLSHKLPPEAIAEIAERRVAELALPPVERGLLP